MQIARSLFFRLRARLSSRRSLATKPSTAKGEVYDEYFFSCPTSQKREVFIAQVVGFGRASPTETLAAFQILADRVPIQEPKSPLCKLPYLILSPP